MAVTNPASKPTPQLNKSSPGVDGFKLKASLKGKMEDISSALRTVSFLEVGAERDAVNAAYIESRDINKMPYLFSILKIKNDELEIVYTIPSEISPKKRRLDMIRYLLNILSLIEPYYKVETTSIYQLIENAVKEISEIVSLDYSKLYTSYDTLKKELDDTKRKLGRFTQENQSLTNRNFELKNKNDEVMLRLKDLETYSDDILKAKIAEWIVEHNGEINIYEFSKVFKVQETRIEQMLNVLMNEGYIESTA